MKTSLPLTIIGAACALLVSCGTSSRDTIFVTTKSGAPIAGAYVVPCTIPYGCEDVDYSNGCGKLALRTNRPVAVAKDGFRTVEGVRATGRTQHIVMVPGKPM